MLELACIHEPINIQLALLAWESNSSAVHPRNHCDSQIPHRLWSVSAALEALLHTSLAGMTAMQCCGLA